MNNDFRQAYLLHRRAHSDSQVMLNMLVEGVGQLMMLARIKGRQALRHNAHLQPFSLLLVRYNGRHDLKYLNDIELQTQPLALKGQVLYCGFYLNELSARVIPVNEPLESMFSLYHQHLMQLHGLADSVTKQQFELTLRSFEFQLLEQLGFGVEFECDADGEVIIDTAYYQYTRELGFVRTDDRYIGFSGKVLQQIARHDFSDDQVRRQAKGLSRYLLRPLLGHKPLKSRELFQPR
ncbi:DNA repair protein RecO [Pseudoalteromonas sp. OOF1S-7]|uniref:DNA repair protein RecO n=1 Tax=Pseudoalteromonas sp. OOF1S-7 TaxID=2917757 RepID=UPI001EF702D1|nr:DNA repair protein RecO [Pseudoalteromonas sp. OOF1S-7]MCG7533722.1 DNA repair protein RecO [Pseudoalteromonas sp. OOF1S-7]